MRSPLNAGRFVLTLLAFASLLAAFVIVSPGIGTQPVGIVDSWRSLFSENADPVAQMIAWDLRFPRTLNALLAGATLALAGCVFQTLFRNPLATPYTLGIASGGSLGALIAIQTGWTISLCGISSVSAAAFAGALCVVLIVLILARSSARISGNTLLLAGVTVGFFCSGMMMFLTSLANVQDTYRIVHWMMGSLQTVGLKDFYSMLPIALPVWLILLLQAQRLNQFELGSEIALSRGINVARLQIVSIVAGSLGVAAIVSVCGPIGFVGLIIPHIARLLVGHDHRLLLPVSALLGATFLIGCNFLTTLIPAWYGTIAGRETSAVQLPIGVMTAIIGTPIFLIMLSSRSR